MPELIIQNIRKSYKKNIVKSFNKNQIKFDKITKILFCSVVPRSFKKIQFFLKKKGRKKKNSSTEREL